MGLQVVDQLGAEIRLRNLLRCRDLRQRLAAGQVGLQLCLADAQRRRGGGDVLLHVGLDLSLRGAAPVNRARQHARRLARELLLQRVRLRLGDLPALDLVRQRVGDGFLEGGVDLGLALGDRHSEVLHEVAADS